MAQAQIKALVSGHVVRAAASDVPIAEVPSDADVAALASALQRYWYDVSKGALELSLNVYPGWARLQETAATLGQMSRWAIGDSIINAVTDDHVGVGDIFIGLVNTPCGGGDEGNRVIGGSFQELGQRCWAWCSNCESLAFWDQSRLPGVCIAGGRHNHLSSAHYVARFEQSGQGELGWRWCKKCECLAHPNGAPGPCAAGGSHDHSSSGLYVAATSATPATQDKWQRCTRCTVMVYGGDHPAPCPAGGNHVLSGTYFVGFDQLPSFDWLAHESGHALGLDHSFNDDPKPLDPGDDARPGAYGDLWDIMSFSNVRGYWSSPLIETGPVLAASTLFKNGWISPNRVWLTAAPTTAQIELVSTSEAIASGYMVAVMAVPRTRSVYSAEFRTPQGWDVAIGAPGVLVREHRADGNAIPSLGLLAQNMWRWCRRCGSLVFRGARACAHGGEHVSDGTALAVPNDLASGGGGQAGWRWCSRCQCIVQQDSGQGPCAAAGLHDTSKSGAYWVDWGAIVPGQPWWVWCRNCKALFSAQVETPRCPAGGQHDSTGSGNYKLSATGGQDQWTNCSRCTSVFYDGIGTCPAGGAHDTTQSSDYFLVHDIEWAPGQAGWRWCSKCYGLAYLDAVRGPGRCAAGGVHDHSQSGAYNVEFDSSQDVSQQQGWAWCRLCEMLAFKQAATRCPAGGSHDFSQSGAYGLRSAVGANGDEGHLQQKKSWSAGETFNSPTSPGETGDLVIEIVGFAAQPSRAILNIHYT